MSLVDLASHISAVLPENPDQVSELILHYLQNNTGDWKQYVYFTSNHYSRNHVIATPQCELIIMCWNPDQNTFIHDHGTSECWMGTLEGAMRETVYAMPDDPFTEYEIQLRPIVTSNYLPGEVGHISNRIGIHEIGAIGVRSVTLHVYAPPLEKIRVYRHSSNTDSLELETILDLSKREWIEITLSKYLVSEKSMFAAFFLAASIILVWIAFTEDKPDVVVVREYYRAPKEIEMTELSTSSTSSTSSENRPITRHCSPKKSECSLEDASL